MAVGDSVDDGAGDDVGDGVADGVDDGAGDDVDDGAGDGVGDGAAAGLAQETRWAAAAMVTKCSASRRDIFLFNAFSP